MKRKRRSRLSNLEDKLISLDTYTEQTDYLKKIGWQVHVIEKEGVLQDPKNPRMQGNKIAYLSVKTTEEQDFELVNFELCP